MNKEELEKLYGKTLFPLMEEMLREFTKSNYTVEMIIEALGNINETIRVGLYLLALERNEGILALKLNKANMKLNQIRKAKFLESFKNNEASKFLATLGKSDKISLMSDLGINEAPEKRVLFSLEERIYYEILSNSIKNDQETDKRNGLEQFLKYKKSPKKA